MSDTSDSKSSANSTETRGFWTTEGQGPLLHWILFELYSKYEPVELHRKLDSLIFRVLKASPDHIVILRQEKKQLLYILCVGREEAWPSVWPEDRIMTAVQNAGLATTVHVGNIAIRTEVIKSGLPVEELLVEGRCCINASVE